ncbi:pyrimidine reductase [Sphaerisporangium krabiense]|uniref:Dihydrofolate reductase n=1 Tax=Sphaerisporangium krabiense TaxID=763782 RepID=A0A7W9DQ51_9ACTN|nr:dihydrofolate reductase family protein [Sphaerisporangium krabiense]MBB5627023.1 dihydrofolate reductase [Sphaerisporangium krabiense]GII65177.1 pyrimidine reductase [Sphaerisporangium krabiense]
MRKIVVSQFISLDGVVEAPETWHFPYFNDEMGESVTSLLTEADALLFGRVTYETFKEAFAGAEGDPVADRMNALAKYVVSTTLDTADWDGTTVVSGDVAALKRAPGGTIAINGSVTLVRSLLRAGLVDELRLLLHPIVVGKGTRLFEDGGQIPLKLAHAKPFTTGVLELTYTSA